MPTESFFNFFSPPQPPVDDDESVASDIEERLELDYQLGEDIDPDEFEDEDDEDEDEDDDEDERGSDRDVDDDSDEEVRRSLHTPWRPNFLPFKFTDLIFFLPFRMVPPSPRRRLPSASKTRTSPEKKWLAIERSSSLTCFMDFLVIDVIAMFPFSVSLLTDALASPFLALRELDLST